MIKMGKLNIDVQSQETFVRPHGFCLVALQTNSRYKGEKNAFILHSIKSYGSVNKK